MTLSSNSSGTSTTPILIGDAVEVPGSSSPPVFTQVNGVNVPAALEVQSTSGAFLGPRMLEAQMNALTPVVPGLEVYVTDGANPGKYIRGAATWNLVAGTGALNNVTVSDVDPETEFSIPIWSGTTNEIMSTAVLIQGINQDQMTGVRYIQGVLNPPDNLPIYGINPNNISVSSEGIGSSGVGTLTLWANRVPQAEVTGSTNTVNIFQFNGSTPGQSPSLNVIGLDGDISLAIGTKGNGQLRADGNGSASAPMYSFGQNNGVGMFHSNADGLGLSAAGAQQIEIAPFSDGTNILQLFGANTGGSPTVSAVGADTDVSLALRPQGSGQIISWMSGTQDKPAYSFNGSTEIGMFRTGGAGLGLSANGAIQVEISPFSDGTNFFKITGATTGNPPTIFAVGADTDVGIQLWTQGAGQISARFNGASEAPMYSFRDDLGTGIYRLGDGPLGFSVGAALQMSVSHSGDGTNYLLFGGGSTGGSVQINAVGADTDVSVEIGPKGNGQIYAGTLGSPQFPMYSFLGANADGMYGLIPGPGLGFSVNGGARASIEPSGINIQSDVGLGMQAAVSAVSDVDLDATLYLGTQGAGNVLVSNSSANFGVGVLSFDSTSTGNISIANGTAPNASVADTIQLYSLDLSAGNTTLGLWTEGTPVSDTVSAISTKNVAISINGTVYYLMAKTIV